MLADDNDFRGIVICDMLAPYLRRSVWDHQREFYNYPAGPRQRVEAALRACVQDHLSFNNNRTGVLAALKCLVESGQLPRSEPVRMRADRSLAIDFAAIADLEVYKRDDVSYYRRLYEDTTHPDIDDLRDELQEISDFVRRIQARGGQVIFLHMPSSGDRLQLEEEFHPKARYWDHFASMCSGIFIHATQLAGERGLSCPDNSHLDADGATRLTTLLVDEMLRQKVIESR